MMISRFTSSVLGSQTARGKSSAWVTLGRQMLKTLALSLPLRKRSRSSSVRGLEMVPQTLSLLVSTCASMLTGVILWSGFVLRA